MSHLSYSFDVAPLNNYLFLLVQYYLYDTNCKIFVVFFFNYKPVSILKEKIYKLPYRWKSIVNNNGNYIILIKTSIILEM